VPPATRAPVAAPGGAAPEGKAPAGGGGSAGGGPLEAARRALALEARALADLGASLGEPFARAVGVLRSVPGRIVATGMGKSGHVAGKTAATLSSTGSPSFFLHPAEAGHGDLGALAPGDAVLAFSNSGETAELRPVVDHAKRSALPLVAITARAESALARHADAALVLPPFEEACPMRLAPTTSTTMQMALGDALAVALLESRGFGPEDFRALHPGGNLGRMLTRVESVMRGGSIPLAAPGDRMRACVPAMTAGGFGCVGIVDGGGALVGIITDGDLRRHMAPDLLERRAEEVMSRDPLTIAPDAPAGAALLKMEESSVGALFVVEGGRPRGVIHLLDLLRLRAA